MFEYLMYLTLQRPCSVICGIDKPKCLLIVLTVLKYVVSDIFLISLIIHLPTMIFVQIAESALMCRRQELKTQWLESKLVNI